MDNNGYQNGMPNGMQSGPQLEQPLSLGQWLITVIIMAIPCVGLIMMFVWGFGQGGNTSRKNYCRAMLILSAIGIVLGVISYATIFAALANALSSYSF